MVRPRGERRGPALTHSPFPHLRPQRRLRLRPLRPPQLHSPAGPPRRGTLPWNLAVPAAGTGECPCCSTGPQTVKHNNHAPQPQRKEMVKEERAPRQQTRTNLPAPTTSTRRRETAGGEEEGDRQGWAQHFRTARQGPRAGWPGKPRRATRAGKHTGRPHLQERAEGGAAQRVHVEVVHVLLEGSKK
jgi:hypothetical protein